MRHSFIFLILCLLSLASFSQYDPSKVNKKAIAAYEQALFRARDNDFKGAIDFINQSISIDPKYVDAWLSLAGFYGQLKNYKASTDAYEKSFIIDTNYTNEYKLPYAINLAGQGEFQKALDAINSMLVHGKLGSTTVKAAEYRKKTFEFALDYAAKYATASYNFVPVNLGDSINTPQSEYYPSTTIDDSLFIFSRKGFGIREDFVQSAILPGHQYSASTIIGGSINEEPSKGAINISQDGEWLIFAGNFPGKGAGSFDLYISYQTPQGWSEPINMGPQINTDFWESTPGLSPDKRVLYFSSNRPGGYGGKDLYVSYRDNVGKWTRAVNMGPGVNTIGDELAPFIHADNNTLYFTSDGWPGYGQSDLYMMRRKNLKEWNLPENLGYPVNTIEHEEGIFISSNGVDAYYASNKSDSRGGLDLYRFELRPDLRPAKTLYVQGTVYNVKDKKGIPASVELTDNSTGEIISRVQTDEQGFYFITVAVGKDYTFSVNRKGFLFYTELYELSKEKADSTYKKDIPLQPIELNATMIFRNLQFETNSFALKDVSYIELSKLLQFLNDNPTLKIEISGHTDNVGAPATNLALSKKRATAVVEYLISKGINAQRLTAKGFGETKPIADNKTEEGRAKNRRTEFKVVGE